MRVPCVFLACAIVSKLCFAQIIEDNACKEYLNVLGEAILEKFTSYGLSNLPDDDVEIKYNVTHGPGYDIQGTLYLEDGFVMDIEDIVCLDKKDSHCRVGKVATVSSKIKFEGLTFFRDFRFAVDDPETIPDQKLGGVVIRPETFYFDFSITHDLVDDNITSKVSSVLQGRVSIDALDFVPYNTLTKRLKKSRPYTSLFPKLEAKWQAVIQTFLDEVTQTIAFPPVEFPTKRS